MNPMDDVEFQSAVKSRIEAMVEYCDGTMADDRVRATRYYLGDVSDKLKTVQGRSSVVSRDLRDTVNDILPSLMRVFMRPKAVEFCPVSAEDEKAAEQATDYVNYVFWNDNPGFRVLHSAIKDALVRRTGIVKVWWDKSRRVTAKRFTGIDDQAFTVMLAELADSPAELLEHEAKQTPNGVEHSFVIKRIFEKGRACVREVPGEEFIISEDATSIDDCSGIAHRTFKRVGELSAMGYDFDAMLALAGTEEDELDVSDDRAARGRFISPSDDDSDEPAMRRVLWVEAYLRMDADGDGIIEWRKVCAAGTTYEVVDQEIVDDHPFADFAVEPEPHRFEGESLFDLLEDVQLINTQLLRLHLDGLSNVVTPRQLALNNAGLDMERLLANEVGSVVTANRPDAVTPLATDKAAPQMALEAYRAMKELRSERTGQNAASMGLHADALQSVSRIASNELVQRAQSRVEMIARVMAEGGVRRMFRLLLRLVTQYQDKERVIRLRNQWVTMDPRGWDPEMDLAVNVGIGNGNAEEKAAFLQGFLQIQQQIMQAAGQQNPWVNAEHVRNALEDLVESTGNIAERYVMPAAEWQAMQQRMAQQPPQPPPDPAMEMIKLEREKAQARIQMDQAKESARIQIEAARLQMDQAREVAKDDRERDELEADIVMRAMKDFGVPPEHVLAFIRQSRAPFGVQ